MNGDNDISNMMKSNFTYFLFLLKGKNVEVQDSAGFKYNGEVQLISKEENELLLKLPNNTGFKMLMLKEVAIMKFRSQDGSRPKFKTDSQTIDYNGGAPGLKKEKTLVKWDEHAPGPENGLEGGEEKDQPFNQFEVIESRFGLKPTYDENSYTTKLHLDQVDEHLKIFAEKQEAELLTNDPNQINKHLLEERNLKPLEEESNQLNGDEEAKYSAVMESGQYKNYQNQNQPKKKQRKNKKKQQSTNEKDTFKKEQHDQPPQKCLDPQHTIKFFNSKLIENPSEQQPHPPELQGLQQQPGVQIIEEEIVQPEEDSIEEEEVVQMIAPSKESKFKLKDKGKQTEKSFVSILLEEFLQAIEVYKFSTITKDWTINKKERVVKQLKKPLQPQKTTNSEVDQGQKDRPKKLLNCNPKQQIGQVQLFQGIQPAKDLFQKKKMLKNQQYTPQFEQQEIIYNQNPNYQQFSEYNQQFWEQQQAPQIYQNNYPYYYDQSYYMQPLQNMQPNPALIPIVSLQVTQPITPKIQEQQPPE